MGMRESKMRKKELTELAETKGAELVAEVSYEKNRYFLRYLGVHYKITRIQFEYLLTCGIFDRQYTIDKTTYYGMEMHVYSRR